MQLFSDDEPHHITYNAKVFGFKETIPDWKEEIDKLKQRGITLYALRCLGTRFNKYYATLAKTFGTKELYLSNFKDTVDAILLCILNSQSK